MGASADRVTDCRLEQPLGGSPFASLRPAWGEAQQVGGESGVPACPLLASLLSAFSSPATASNSGCWYLCSAAKSQLFFSFAISFLFRAY